MTGERDFRTAQWINLPNAIANGGFNDASEIVEAVREGIVKINPESADPNDPDLESKPFLIDKASFNKWLNDRSKIDISEFKGWLENNHNSIIDKLNSVQISLAILIIERFDLKERNIRNTFKGYWDSLSARLDEINERLRRIEEKVGAKDAKKTGTLRILFAPENEDDCN